MKRKTMALMLALSICLSLLSACGAGDTVTSDKPPESENVASSTEQQPAESNKPEESKKPTDGKPDESVEPTQLEPENSAGTEPAVPAEMTYTFDTATGTLICSGGGEINKGAVVGDGYINVIKNTLFETDANKCQKEIKKVVIEDGVTAIGNQAFEGLAITEIAIPDSVTQIDNNAFRNTQLTSVTIPDSVTELGSCAFAGCENLSSVTLSKNLTSISSETFYCCTSLTSIQIPESVTEIEGGAFGVSGLTSVTIPDGVTSIGEGAFEGWFITQITIPASVTRVSFEAPAGVGFESLTDVTFLGDTDMDNVQNWLGELLRMPVTIHAPAGSVIEGYVNRQIAENGAKCTFEPIN